MFQKINSFISMINDKIALSLTAAMSTMFCVYLFLFIAVLPLAAPSMQELCMYISSTVIQLIALPLIMVGQNLMGREQERRSKQDHAALMHMLKEMNYMLKHEDDDDKVMNEILRRVTEPTQPVPTKRD